MTTEDGTPTVISVPVEFWKDIQQVQEAERRYQSTGDRAALDVVAAAWERILRHPTFAASDARFQLVTMNEAGIIFQCRYQAAGNPDDLNRALELWQEAVQRTPPDSSALPSHLNNLGTGLHDRYACIGRLEDLAAAICTCRTAVQRTPPGSRNLAHTPQQPGRRPARPLRLHWPAGGPGRSDSGLSTSGGYRAAGRARPA